jgi:hypothetical protein
MIGGFYATASEIRCSWNSPSCDDKRTGQFIQSHELGISAEEIARHLQSVLM